ncbi:MAG TPA: dTDP-4-dehydrorhamnose reductase [Bacteroidales bacterium]|nr:dTDP-4-dehydrorhamnose reductase [Bacteroidales bacterium]
MFKILVTGALGMLGHDILSAGLSYNNIEIKGIDINDFNLLHTEGLKNYISESQPNVVIHCAAFTDVDKAESMPEQTFKINSAAVRDIANVCNANQIKLILISTDYVFNGSKQTPYYEYDTPEPINIYGWSKYYAENYVRDFCNKYFIVRTSWLFGINGNNFVKTILNKAKTEKELKIVNDQVGSPTYTKDLAKFLIELSLTDKYGIYHVTNSGYCSWYEFAKEILKISNKDIKLIPIESKDLVRLAKRPLNSVLHKTALMSSGFTLLQNWKLALEDYLRHI